MNDVPPSIGERYRLLKPIGAGAWGIVYQGVDRQTDEIVAVKQLNPEAVVHSPDVLERFRREGEALRQLNHPNIVKVLATLEENSQHYIVMEYVSGGSLADLLKAQPRLPIARVLAIALELADALARAHHLKIIHRDIKPANVLLAEDGTPRLTDFGVAHVGEASITESGAVVGTIAYLCPEAFSGGTLDARADLWAFGVLLFEILTGRRPFAGESTSAIIGAILNQRTPDLEALRPDAPVALVDLIYRMLEKNKEERIPSARLVGAEIESVIRYNWPDKAERTAVVHSTSGIELTGDTLVVGTDVSTPAKRFHNLPAQTTPFVGREDELTRLATLLAKPDVRLITILAAGGMGKTRLSLEIATSHVSHFPDGVYFVELAPLSTPEHIVTAVADAVGVQFVPGSDPKEQLLNSFRHKQMLLVMDNFEHLLEGVAFIREILEAARHVTILVTSRERLNLSSETVFVLSGMDFPDWETPADALAYGAVKLFLQSALRAKPDFALSGDDLTFLARICRLVAGMPLGIVLTAAWVAMLSLEEIADEIPRSLDFLDTDMRDIPERQRSIRGVFEQSYRRLNADEQGVFRMLTVFRGGFTREAAQVVAGASLRTLLALTNKSLLRRDPNGRYQIHELLRQFGELELINAGEVLGVQEAHATYFAHFLQQRWDDLKGQRQVVAMADIEAEFENIRPAWRWLVDGQRELELGKTASSLWFYLYATARYYEGVDLFGYAVDIAHSLDHAHHDPWVLAHLLGRLASLQGFIGLFAKCKTLTDEALSLLENSHRLEEMVMLLSTMTELSRTFAHYEEACKTGEEALRIAQAGDNEWAKLMALGSWNTGLYNVGKNLTETRRICQDVLAQYLVRGNVWDFIRYSEFAAEVALEQHSFQEAERFCRQALLMSEKLHILPNLSFFYTRLGASLVHQGHETEAKSYFHRGIKTTYDLAVTRQTLMRILTTIEYYFLQVDKLFAVELLAMLLNHPACDNTISGWTEKTIVILNAELSPEVYQAAWNRGELWGLDQAVTLVLERLS